MKSSILTVAIMLASTSTVAQDMQPGQWSITLTMTTPSAPNQNFGPYTNSYCMSERDVADPTLLFGSVGATPSTCVYSNRQSMSSGLNFDISCQGMVPLSGKGQTNWTEDTMSSTLQLNTQMPGEPPLATNVNISARRTGGC